MNTDIIPDTNSFNKSKEFMTHNERAKLGQSINLACNQLRGTEYTEKEVISLVFDKYLPLINSIKKEYVLRRETMTQFLIEEETIESSKDGIEEETIEPPKQILDELDELL